MKGFCPECNKEIDETEYTQFKGICNACAEKKNLRELILRLKFKLMRISLTLNTLRALDQLDNSELIYYLNIRMLVHTLEIYDSYMLKKIYEITERNKQ